MNKNCYIKVLLVFSILILSTRITLSKGIESGGGGDTISVDTIKLLDLENILQSSRAELILFFNSQTAQEVKSNKLNDTVEYKKLFQGTQSIIDVIKKTQIYLESSPYHSCKDQNNNDVDGSIHSLKPNTICISEWRLQKKLSLGTARGQVLALLAHEYSHLLGLNENEATILQGNILRVVEEDSKDKIEFALDALSFNFGALRGSFINDGNYNSSQKNWNYHCYLSGKVSKYIEEIREHKSFNQYSLFNKVDGQRFHSFILKSRALYDITCGNSDYHPSRDSLKKNYNSAFGSADSISVEQWNTINSVIPFDIDKTINLKRVITVDDFNEELNDLKNYTEIEFHKFHELKKIYSNGFIRN